MTKLAAAVNSAAANGNDDDATSLRALRMRLRPTAEQAAWHDWTYETPDPFEEVLKAGYFAHCAETFRRFDRIHLTCTRDALDRGDKLAPAVHAVLIVSRVERQPGGAYDVRVTPLCVARELPNAAPRLDHEGKLLPVAA
jgi:hypothetical protein